MSHDEQVQLVLPEGKTPYPIQVEMFEAMLRRFREEKNVMIEAPTGSGKSLALLGAIREWMRTHQDAKIYLCSRTHQRLDQMAEVLKGSLGRDELIRTSRLTSPRIVPLLRKSCFANGTTSSSPKRRQTIYCGGVKNST